MNAVMASLLLPAVAGIDEEMDRHSPRCMPHDQIFGLHCSMRATPGKRASERVFVSICAKRLRHEFRDMRRIRHNT